MGDAQRLSSAEERALVAQVRAGSTQAFSRLAKHYERTLSFFAGRLVVPALEEDDLIQEGLLALSDAANCYDESRGASFSTFARHCIYNRMLTARGEVAALPTPVEEDETFTDGASTGQAGPETIVVARDEDRLFDLEVQKRLSPFEYDVLREFLDGYSYKEVAARLHTTAKAVDNALSRVRRKLKDFVYNRVRG